MFRKILIANRSEIALRIIRTCKRLGVKTVAVYSDADLESKHVTSADEAYGIGSGRPAESYLNISKIIRAARKSGAEAVHPGYGFLAENPDLARACEESRIVFIGPSSKVLSQVSNKLESKKQAKKAGVPIVPGSTVEIESVEQADSEARKIGFPILIKAAYGGGGRGMRIVRSSRELQRALESARSEAQTGFGHPELYVEKYLEYPRHVEVQILAGHRSRIVHLGERECSLQRRYQKILEETPSPALDSKGRRRLVSLALRVVKASRYENAGTVEFVISNRGELYYLETNKRIQVEHLISEMVTGVDIVEKQLTIASEHQLDVSQDEIKFNGAALNCRINAEDPDHGLAPSPGVVTRFVSPGGPGVRVDTALFDGAPVPEYYDSLIAKLATHGLDRDQAVERMRVALAEMTIDGVKTTIPIHQAVLETKGFLQGNYHTHYLDTMLSSWKPRATVPAEEAAAAFLAIKRGLGPTPTPEASSTTRQGWRTGLQDQPTLRPALYVEGV